MKLNEEFDAKKAEIDAITNIKNSRLQVKNFRGESIKEKKAFGPGARDIKPLKPSIIQEPSKPFSNIKRIINCFNLKPRYISDLILQRS
jgi:hypothetical protein